VQNLSAVIPSGSRVLIRSVDAAARAAIMRAAVGIWDEGDGRIIRPPLEQVAFLPERPYIPPGTLRDALGGQDGVQPASAEELEAVLAALGVEDIVARAGGLEEERDWDELLSLGEQQILSIARLLLSRPRFVFVDHLGRALDDDQVVAVCDAFARAGITCVTMGDDDAALDGYDAVLDVARDGRWSWTTLKGETIGSDVQGGRTQ
jgi:putative ATP-binding cassette transporter